MEHGSGRQLLRGGRIVTPAGVIPDGEILVDGGTIRWVGPAAGLGPGPAATEGARRIGLDGRWIVPGLIDLHVHGGGGADATVGGEAGVRALARFHAGHGTTSMLPTTVPVPLGGLQRALSAIAAVARAPGTGEARVLGSNLEGPFVSAARAGALDPRHLLEPDPAALDRLLAAGRGTVRIVTVAPELPDALELIGAVRSAGAVAAIGHTDATYRQATAGIEAGARHVTHLGNGMRGLDRREPGVVGALLDASGVTCELICDGAHLDPAFVRIVHRAKGAGSTVLVTDATAGAGMPSGTYPLGTGMVAVAGGRRSLAAAVPSRGATAPLTPDDAAGRPLAGSTLTLDAALRNAIDYLGASLPEAVDLVTRSPARLLGLEGRKGVIAAGADADLVLLGPELGVEGVLVAGRWVLDPVP